MSNLISREIGFVSVNQYSGGTGHANITIWDRSGNITGTFGKNINAHVNGWQEEGRWYADLGRRVNKSDLKLPVDAAHGAAIRSYLEAQVDGGLFSEPYVFVPGGVCVDGVNHILDLGGIPGTAADYMVDNGTDVFRYAAFMRTFMTEPLIPSPLTPMHDLFRHTDFRPTEVDLGHLSPSWHPVKLKRPMVIIGEIETGHTMLDMGAFGRVITTDTRNADWDGWWAYGEGGSSQGSSPDISPDSISLPDGAEVEFNYNTFVEFDTLERGVSVNLVTGAMNSEWGPAVAEPEIQDIYASAFKDQLTGSVGDNMIYAFEGDDIIVGEGGSDYLDGGDGVDTASYAGPARAYVVSAAAAAGTVTGGPEGGTDTLVSIERVQFADGVLSFDREGLAAKVMRLYDTVLQRGPDSWGLNTWVHELEAGTTLEQAAARFATSYEFMTRTGGLNTAQFVDYMYQNTLHRAADAEGRAFWIDQLDSGTWSRGQIVLLFSESAEHVANTAGAADAGLFIYDQTYAAVSYLWEAAYDRLPDWGASVGWTAILRGGTTLEWMAGFLSQSAEFQADIAGRDHGGVVDYLYQTVLNRPADAATRAAATAELDAGGSYGTLLLRLAMSDEHQIIMQPAVEHGIVYV